MAATGHLTEEMFNWYDTVDEDDLKEGINKFQGFLQGQSKSVQKQPAEAGKTQ